MSGILGIWNRDGQPLQRAMLQKLSSILAHRGDDGEGCWVEGPVGFAFQNFWVTPESVGESQPLVRPREHIVCFDGRLDNREQLLNSLAGESEVEVNSSDAQFVSAAYRKYGDALPEYLNGDFAVTVYDLRHRRLLLARDGIGICPLYFAEVGDCIIVASEIKPILAFPGVTPKPNADMVAAYLLACFGQERQGWTFFDGVSAVVPGQVVVVTPHSIRKHVYWDFSNPKPIQFKSSSEYAEAFRHHFQNAVARRLRSAYPVSVSLSGGLDSSSIFCMGEHLRSRQAIGCPKLVGVHIVGHSPESDEGPYVEEIERRYSIRIHRVDRRVARLVEGEASASFRDMEVPFCRAPLDARYPSQRAARSQGARVVLVGTFGDQMLASESYLIDLFLKGRWLTVRKHVENLSHWTGETTKSFLVGLLHDLIRHPIPGSWMPQLRELRRKLRKDRPWYTGALWTRARRAEHSQRFTYSGKSAYQRSLYGLVRPMYYTQALEWSNKTFAVNHLSLSFPFFDRDLISFLLALPGEVSCQDGVPKALLREAMFGILPDAIRDRRWKAGNSDDLNTAAEDACNQLETLLGAKSIAATLGYVDSRNLKASLGYLRSRVHRDSCLSSRLIGDLLGLELWLQTFFGNEVSTVEKVTEAPEYVGQTA